MPIILDTPRISYEVSKPGQTYWVQNKKADANEYYTALALDATGKEYEFQVSVLGGRRLRGGLVLDFLVHTVPLYTPLWVNGEYWHAGLAKERDYIQSITFDWSMKGMMNKAIVLWGNDTSTPEAALAAVRKNFA